DRQQASSRSQGVRRCGHSGTGGISRHRVLTNSRTPGRYDHLPRNTIVCAGRFAPMTIANSVLDIIGNTPLVKLNRVTDGCAATVLVKLEYVNPGGSSKDRIAQRIIDAAEREGLLGPGGTIVEPTSGNTGIGLALVAQQRGYRCVFVCPDKVSEDK